MVRTKYYETSRAKKAVARMIADGAENLEGSSFKDYLPHEGEDEVKYYSAILDYIGRFLDRFSYYLDAVEFFDKYMEIRDDIIKTIEDPEDASISSSILASSEFGEVIVKHKTPFDVIKWELDREQDELDKRHKDALLSSGQFQPCCPSMPPTTPNPYAAADYNPFMKYNMIDAYSNWHGPLGYRHY